LFICRLLCPQTAGTTGARALARAPACSSFCCRLLLDLASLPVGNLPLAFFLADAIGFLHLGRKLLALAGRAAELLVGELAPLLLGIGRIARPAGFDLIPVHGVSFASGSLPIPPERGMRRGRHAGGLDVFLRSGRGAEGSLAAVDRAAVTTGYFRNTLHHTPCAPTQQGIS